MVFLTAGAAAVVCLLSILGAVGLGFATLGKPRKTGFIVGVSLLSVLAVATAVYVILALILIMGVRFMH